MLEEVFPQADVKAILERFFVVIEVDVDADPEAAKWFQTSGVPDL